MNKEFAKRLFTYNTTVVIMKRMLSDGVISEEEYNIIDTIIAEKYGFNSSSIYRFIP